MKDVSNQIDERLWDQILSLDGIPFNYHVWGQMEHQVRDQVMDQLWDQVMDQVLNQVKTNLTKELS